MDKEEDNLSDGEEIEVIYLDDDENIEELMEGQVAEDEDDLPEIEDLATVTFRKHKKSIFCSTFNGDGTLAATGGEDDMAYVWGTDNGEVHLECSGHSDSIIMVEFSFDSRYLATGDMSGLVQVWEIATKNLVWCNESDDMEWLRWHPSAHVLLVGTVSGSVYMWKIPQGDCKLMASHGSSAHWAKVLPDGQRLVVGYLDGQLKLWDLKTSSVIWQLPDSTKPAAGIVSLDVSTDASLIIVTPSAQVFKLTDGKPVANLLPEGELEVEAALFNTHLNVAATGSLSGMLCIWDLAKNAVRHQTKLNHSITVMKWASEARLVIGDILGNVHVFDARAGCYEGTLTGHFADILSISISPDKRLLLTTSDDATAKIFLDTSNKEM